MKYLRFSALAVAATLISGGVASGQVFSSGPGLGLPIACQIAEEHHGGVAARNRREGGLEVTISLPVVSS